MDSLRFFLSAISRQSLRAVPTIVGILLINFFLLQQVPGDAVDIMAAEAGGASAESMQAMREAYGLLGTWWQQLGNYLGPLARGDLGVSPRFNEPVLDLIFKRLPNSLFLVILDRKSTRLNSSHVSTSYAVFCLK